MRSPSAVAAGTLTAEAVTELGSIASPRPSRRSHAFIHHAPEKTRALAAVAVQRAACRRPIRHQGCHRDARHADGIWFGCLSRLAALPGCAGRPSRPPGRRGLYGQDGLDRICHRIPRRHRQSVRSEAHAGRLFQWHGGGARCRADPARPRHPDLKAPPSARPPIAALRQ